MVNTHTIYYLPITHEVFIRWKLIKLQKIKKGREKPMKNLIKKYGISFEKFLEGVGILSENLNLIQDSNVRNAISELLAEGDINPQSKPILVRDITERLVECYIEVWKSGNYDADESDFTLAHGYGFIENEEILDLEVKSIRIDGANSLQIQVC